MSKTQIAASFFIGLCIVDVGGVVTMAPAIPLVAAEPTVNPKASAGPKSWQEFRGNNADGLAPGAQLPTTWSDDENCVWKTRIHDRGWSSPVVSEDGEIWLTTATADGLKMFVVCVDLETGEIKHDQLLIENDSVQEDYHVTNSYASPTPVIDGEQVFVTFGAYGTFCLDRADCQVKWKRLDLKCNHYRGAGSSPIIYKDLLIFHMDGFDFQYAIALNKSTGKTVWKADRDIDYGTDNGDFYKAFSTPIVITVNRQDQLISPASMACIAMDPATGKEIWRVRYEEHSTTVRPIFDGERLYLSTGFGKAKMLCVRVGGAGDVTDTHVGWIQRKSIGSKPSPLLANGNLYDLTDAGILERIDMESGEIVWQTRLGGKFSASLVADDKHMFAFDHEGKGYAFTLSDEPELVAENSLLDGCNASPAIVGDNLIVRTKNFLYCFRNTREE